MTNIQKQIENNKLLLALVEAEPDSLVNLSRWEQKTDCGTLHCIGGLAALHSHFQEQGLCLVYPHGNVVRLMFNGCTMISDVAAFELLGNEGMFMDYHCGPEHHNSEICPPEINHKQLAINRLQWNIKRLESKQND